MANCWVKMRVKDTVKLLTWTVFKLMQSSSLAFLAFWLATYNSQYNLYTCWHSDCWSWFLHKLKFGLSVLWLMIKFSQWAHRNLHRALFLRLLLTDTSEVEAIRQWNLNLTFHLSDKKFQERNCLCKNKGGWLCEFGRINRHVEMKKKISRIWLPSVSHRP